MQRSAAAVVALMLVTGAAVQVLRDGRDGAAGPRIAEATSVPPVVQSFVSRPDLHPPIVRVLTRTPRASRGSVFVGAKVGPGQRGPMIVDGRGRLVWFNPLPGRELAFDFRVQRLRGKPVLTWWQGRVQHGHGRGVGVIADSNYKVIARVRAGHGLAADLHEFKLTRRGTALITVYDPVRRDLRSIGGPRDGTAVDSIVQEVDIRSGRVLFEWHSIGNVGFRESHWRTPRTSSELYDYFHVNSIDELPDGNLLISARNTSALYKIDRRSGEVLWRLGGRRSDFALGPGARFSGQHDARRLADGTIMLFDNGFPPAPGRESRVIVLRLDERRRRATLVRSLRHPLAPHSHSQAGAQPLRGGNTFVGWGGAIPYFSEFSRSGRLVFDARFASSRATSYRAYRMPWRGRPGGAPVVAVRGERAYVSWNGASEVAAWRVAGTSRRVRRAGFETAVPLGDAPRPLVIEALDARGRVLGRSRPGSVDARK